MNERRGNPPFQFRLDPELRKAMEEAQRLDGDESLAAWIKRIIRKELKQKGFDIYPPDANDQIAPGV